jgi:hypothetical protein
MTITITPSQSIELMMDVLKQGLVPMLTSSPGLGKSSLAKQIAEEQNLKVIDLRLSQCDPTDLGGFPMINEDKSKASYVPMNTFPIVGDPIPTGYSGWLLLMDEFNSAPQSVQAAAYKIVLDKEVGLHKLHNKVAIICAGNLITDKAIVTKLSTAMQSRMIHFEMEANLKDWLNWAAKESIDYRITSFINFRPELLHSFDPDHSDKTFPCPRTWEFLSKIIKGWASILPNKAPIIAGTIGEGPAMEFTSFCSIYDRLPTIEQIIKDPLGIEISTEPSILYATSGMIGAHITRTNIDLLMSMIIRLPIEFQINSLREAIMKDRSFMKVPGIAEWIAKNSKALL